MKIVINGDYGGYQINNNVLRELWMTEKEACDLERTDERLVKAVEKLGKKAGDLIVIEIPDGIKYKIFNYDGLEFVAEEGHYWGYDL